MASKKKPAKRVKEPAAASAPSWQVILEEIRSQNRAAMEVVDAHHEEMRRDLQSFRGEVHADISMLRTIVQGQSIDIRDLKAGTSRLETKVDKLETKVDTLETKVDQVDAKVDRLVPLEERVAVLERRGA